MRRIVLAVAGVCLIAAAAAGETGKRQETGVRRQETGGKRNRIVTVPERPKLIDGVKAAGITGGASGARVTNGSELPATCTAGDGFLKNEAGGTTYYVCTASGGWAVLSDRSGVWSAGRPYLREWGSKIAKIQNAAANAQAVVLWLGDSWTSGNTITDPLRVALQRNYGNAGAGYAQFDSQSAPPGGASLTSTGAWTDSIGSDTPGINANSTTSTDSSTPASKAVTSYANSFVLHYATRPGGGEFRWRVDAGAWTAVATDGASGFATVSATGLSNASHTLTVEVVSAGTSGVTLLGTDCRRNDNGVRFHRIGHPGALAETYASRNAQFWNAALGALGPSLVVISLGTNDHITNRTPEAMKTHLTTMIGRIRTAAPGADIVLLPPSDNGQTGVSHTLAEFAAMQEQLARELGTGFVDGYKHIGTYSEANARGLYANSTHINAEGGRLIANLMESYLMLGLDPSAGGSIGIGRRALGGGANGNRNTAVGFDALRQVATDDNTAFGSQALQGATTGASNTAIGANALYNTTTGSNNVAVGPSALASNTGGQNNTAVGWRALNQNGNASNSTAVGYGALQSSTGTSNTAFGTNALNGVTSGTNNVAVGMGAGVSSVDANKVTTGSFNTFVGNNAGPGSTTQRTYLTVIGAGATGDEDNAVVLGRVTDKVRVVSGRLHLGGGTEPACDAASRGMLVFVAGGTGVKDSLRVCAKDTADGYGWRSIY